MIFVMGKLLVCVKLSMLLQLAVSGLSIVFLLLLLLLFWLSVSFFLLLVAVWDVNATGGFNGIFSLIVTGSLNNVSATTAGH